MDKIIGLGNALVDVLATLEDDTLLEEMGLPKGSMQLIDDAKLQQINTRFSQMKTHQATGGSAGNAILGLACLGAGTGFIGIYFRSRGDKSRNKKEVYLSIHLFLLFLLDLNQGPSD